MGVFTMPSLGADMDTGILVEWLVAPGDTVKRGDVVAAVETQKGAIEIEIFENGTVHELLAQLGADLPVGAPLAIVLAEGETPPDPSVDVAADVAVSNHGAPEPEQAPVGVSDSGIPVTAAPPVAPASAPPVAPTVAPTSCAAPAANGDWRASPAARMRADTLGVDLGSLRGSGPGGAILIADVEHAAPKRTPPKSSPIDEMRKAIAAAMTRSKQTIPHFYLSETIDVDPAIAFLEARNADVPPAGRVLLGAIFVRAATLAAAKVKVMNGQFTDDAGFVPSTVVNPGVAIALRGGGLVAPALMDAVEMTLEDTMSGMRDLVTRARAGRLRASEMTAGTITISSLGETGAEAMSGVIFPPQVALVGIGAPHLRPWIVGEAIVPRHVVTLTMSADHRVSDGRQAARFISEFERLVQNPEDL
jgi:pyruvate dehydrogenase E2 component (dihydrolipoamide acetyltransferase)